MTYRVYSIPHTTTFFVNTKEDAIARIEDVIAILEEQGLTDYVVTMDRIGGA